MNKNFHRIVFNAARGVRMVVQETARSVGKAAGATPGVLATALAGLLASAPAPAQIVGAPNVPGTLRPTVLVAPNGVPLVNIQTPSAAGVSRNLYHQFDVQSRGVILNNSRTNVQTQLGGWVPGNPYLATGPARIILNEIVSGNPTQLRGAIEVGGQRAEVVVANPAGITVEGGGFLNASKATLTTGTPQLNAFGGLDGYLVRGGTVRIDGAGLDARGSEATILARAAAINAGIWADRLSIVTGTNQVSADHAQVTPVAGTGTAPVFALDVAQLGGMYAGHIFLVGTEAGLGMRNVGTIQAAGGGLLAGPGELVVTAGGRLENIGTMQATGRADIAAGSLANSGRIASSGNLKIATQGTLGNTGGTLEAQSLQLASAGDIDNRRGTMRQTSGVGLTVTASVLSNTAGGVIGAEPLSDTPAQPGTGTGGAGTSGSTTPDVGTGTGMGSTGTGTTSSPVYVPAPGHIAASGSILNDAGRITRRQKEWQVTIVRGNVARNKTFTFSVHGGVGPALARAQAWRDEIVRLYPAMPKRDRAVRLQSNNKSGIAGVSARLGPDGKPCAWTAKTELSSGRQLQKTFSVGRFGERAKDMAIAERQRQLEQMRGRVSLHMATHVDADE